MAEIKLSDGNYSVYVLLCEGGFYYVGVSKNVKRRFAQHQSGLMGAAFTKRHKPLKIVFNVSLGNISYAEAEEYEDCVTLEMIMKYGERCVGGRYLFPISTERAKEEYTKKCQLYKRKIERIAPPAPKPKPKPKPAPELKKNKEKPKNSKKVSKKRKKLRGKGYAPGYGFSARHWGQE